jgi:hypothetical protein
VGATGLIVARWLGAAPAAWAAGAAVATGALLVALAGAVFARRTR